MKKKRRNNNSTNSAQRAPFETNYLCLANTSIWIRTKKEQKINNEWSSKEEQKKQQERCARKNKDRNEWEEQARHW